MPRISIVMVQREGVIFLFVLGIHVAELRVFLALCSGIMLGSVRNVLKGAYALLGIKPEVAKHDL